MVLARRAAPVLKARTLLDALLLGVGSLRRSRFPKAQSNRALWPGDAVANIVLAELMGVIAHCRPDVVTIGDLPPHSVH